LAGQVLLKIVWLLMRWLFSLAVLVFRGDQAKNAELLVLRHENAVLRRNAGRIRYEPGDRAWFAALAPFIPCRRWAEVFPVAPATLLAWHRRLAARKYDTSKGRQPGRPPTVRSVARLAVRLAHENPLWGYRRIHGDLTKLGLKVTRSMIADEAGARAAGAPRADRTAAGGGTADRRSEVPRPPLKCHLTWCRVETDATGSPVAALDSAQTIGSLRECCSGPW
jgi:hypothetical protein